MITRTPRPFIAAAALALVAAGCTSSRNSTEGTTMSDRIALERTTSVVYEVLSPSLDVVPNGDGTWSFIFSAGASGAPDSRPMQLLRGLREASFTVVTADGRVVDSLVTTDIQVSGVQGADAVASLTATARVMWTPSTTPVPPMQVIMRVAATEGTIVRVREIPIAPTSAATSEPLALSLDIEPRGGVVELALHVERRAAGPADEYLPSGERFRIEIFGDAGERVWSSSSGQMFTQAIGPVEPTRIGERVTYRAIFDGRNDETRAPLAAGTYRVVATIPARPRPYVLREELTWGTR